MKKLSLFFLILFLSFGLGHSLDDSGYYSYRFARVSYVQGDVFIQRASDLGDEAAVVNMPLVEGDKLGTQNGRVEIHFGRKNFLRIAEHSQIDFAEMPERNGDPTSLHLFQGSAFLRIYRLEREKEFELHTPDASFYVLDEGLYRFDVDESGETAVEVLEGMLEAAGEEGSLLVKERERLLASNGSFLSDPEYMHSLYEDDLYRWNETRDALDTRYASRQYLPAELDEYEAELAYNGRWVYERPYGYVWIPYVSHYSWRPYYNGRWAWYPVIGWTWISYEPWGWCVSHYGRWHWRSGLGWYWIPMTVWRPAWVHWYWGQDYIGWCPLSYYGYPVVVLNNNFYGRFYDHYYPVNSRALVVVRKDQLQSRRISSAALNRAGLSKIGKITLSSRQPSVQPKVERMSLTDRTAQNALSRNSVRQIRKGYISQGTARASRANSSLTLMNRSSSSGVSAGVFKRYQSSPEGQRLRSSTMSREVSQSRSSTAFKSRLSGRTGLAVSPSRSKPSQVKEYPSSKLSRPPRTSAFSDAHRSSRNESSFQSLTSRDRKNDSSSFSSQWNTFQKEHFNSQYRSESSSLSKFQGERTRIRTSSEESRSFRFSQPFKRSSSGFSPGSFSAKSSSLQNKSSPKLSKISPSQRNSSPKTHNSSSSRGKTRSSSSSDNRKKQ